MANVERVKTLEDPRLAWYRGVSDPELARANGLFIAEGRLVVRRVLDDSRYTVRSVLVNDAAYRGLEPALAARASVPVFICATEAFSAIAGFDIHRGCLAIVERPPERPLRALVAEADRVVVLDDVANADNVGGVFRNAAAFDAQAVLLSPACCDPWYRKAVKTSMGAVLRVPFGRCKGWPAELLELRREGFTIAALSPRGRETLDDFATRAAASRLALLVGAEGHGLAPGVESLADASVRIPVSAAVDSLNLAVAVGIALARLRR